MKKAVFFDIDGTLIDGQNGKFHMSTEVKDAIRFVQENGDYALIATGRPNAFLPTEILEFGFDGFVLANGAHVVLHGDIIWQSFIDPQFVQKIIPIFEQHQIQYVLEGISQSYLKYEFAEFRLFYERFGILPDLLVGNYDLNEVKPLKIEMLCKDAESEEICMSIIRENPEYDYVHSVSIKAFELYPKSNTKATGIQKVLDRLGIPIENSYAFGDGKNDIEMLQSVGCGIAMGNAAEEVKKHAKKVTGTVSEDGVAAGIHKYVL